MYGESPSESVIEVDEKFTKLESSLLNVGSSRLGVQINS